MSGFKSGLNSKNHLLKIIIITIGAGFTIILLSDFFGQLSSSVLYSVFVLYSFIILYICVKKPRLGTLLLGVTTPFSPEFPIPIPGFSSAMVNADFVLIGILSIRLIYDSIDGYLNLELANYLSYVISFGFISIISLYPVLWKLPVESIVSLFYLGEWLIYCTIPILMIHFLHSEDVKLFFAIMFCGFAAIEIHLLSRHLVLGIPNTPDGVGRYANPFGPGSINRLRAFWAQNSNAVGAFLSIHTIAGISIIPTIDRKYKYSLYPLLLISVYLLFWTFSRSAILMLLIGSIIVGGKYLVVRIVALSGVSGPLLYSLNPDIYTRFTNTFRPSKYTQLPIGGLDSRIASWISHYGTFKQSPITGSGFHLVPERLERQNPGLYLPIDNGHLQVLYGTGVVGYLAFMCIFMYILRACMHTIHTTRRNFEHQVSRGILALTIAFLIGGFFYDFFGRWRLLGPLFCYFGLACLSSNQ